MTKYNLKCLCGSPSTKHLNTATLQGLASPMKPGEMPFNPQASLYKTCCAHVRTATIVFGIIEIFAICFILVAVLPDMHMSVCKPLTPKAKLLPPPLQQLLQQNLSNTAAGKAAEGAATTTAAPVEDTNEKLAASINWIKAIACDLNVLWLVWAIAQIFAVNLMFYGIKNVMWYLYLPHLFFRVACLKLLGLICYVIFIRITIISSTTGAYVLASGLSMLILSMWIYIIICEVRCMHFTKRSAETGFSVSQTRQFAPPTTSLSDHAHAATRRGKEALQQLPPLRHGYGVKRTDKQQNERQSSAKSVRVI